MRWDTQAASASQIRASHEALLRYASAAAPDEVFLEDMQRRIDAAAARRASDSMPAASSHDFLRVLLLSYSGAGNTGADLRTIETIEQVERVLAHRSPRITLLALGSQFDHPVLARITKLTSPLEYLPDILDAAMCEADVVINVEGSTYTSKFSDSLAGILIGGLALAQAHGCAAIAYGIDSGTISAPLERFVRHNAARSTVICRNEAARTQLAGFGIATEQGADTAWSWRAAARAERRNERIVALCPNNPFWWPVCANAPRAAALDYAGKTSPLRYGPLHFHSWDDARALGYEAYLNRFAEIGRALQERGYTPVVVGMESLDAAACADLAARLPPGSCTVVVRGPDNLATVATTVAQADCVVTTRYHAAVLALSHGVPAFGLSMDERIARLLDEAGLSDWHARCDAPNAAVLALERIATLDDANQCASVVAACEQYADTQRTLLESMGRRLADAIDGR